MARLSPVLPQTWPGVSPSPGADEIRLCVQGDAIDRPEVSMFRFMGAAGYHGTDVDLRTIGSVEPWSVGDCHWASSADEAFVVHWQWPRRGMPIVHLRHGGLG